MPKWAMRASSSEVTHGTGGVAVMLILASGENSGTEQIDCRKGMAIRCVTSNLGVGSARSSDYADVHVGVGSPAKGGRR